MRDWRKEFNTLPDEVREIACALSCKENIVYLEREKDRLKKRYKQSISEINAHIKGHKEWFRSAFGESIDKGDS